MKCSLDYPSCERCRQRGSACEYPTSPINSPQASQEHYSLSDRSDRHSSGDTDLLSPYSIYSNDDIYSTSRPRPIPARSPTNSNAGSQWFPNTSSFAVADPSSSTEYPLYSPSYTMGSFGSNMSTSSMSDYAQPPNAAMSYFAAPGFDSPQTYDPNAQFYGDSSQRYLVGGAMNTMAADPYSRSNGIHRGVVSGNSSIPSPYSSGTPYNYGYQRTTSQGYSGGSLDTANPRPYASQSSTYSGGSSGARHASSTHPSMSYAMSYEPSHTRSPGMSSAFEARPQRGR